MEKITIEVKRKHFLNAEQYCSVEKCPLALALKDKFKNSDVSVGGLTLTIDKISYKFDHDYWDMNFVDSKIEEAQKCLKSKKKFNNVFLELIKQ